MWTLPGLVFNDITQTYAIDTDQRVHRARALMESVLYTFLHPAGAMRSAQAPHIVDVQGVISLSSHATPAPTVSPLKTGYEQQINAVVSALERVAPGAVAVEGFDSLSSLTNIFGHLLENALPYELRYQ